jgi:hypothetical protein
MGRSGTPRAELWRGRAGAALSVGALGLAVASLAGGPARACPTPEGSSSLDVTPLLIFALATIAAFVDLRAVRRGGPAAYWGRVGLAVVGLAAVLGIWGATAGFFRSGCG